MPTTRQTLRERLAEATLDLLRIPSVTGDEREIAHYVERWALDLRDLGRDDILRRGNSLVIGQPDGHRPCVALIGHLDTVPPHDDDPPPGLEGDRIIGRGSSDMKGGIAVMQVLLEELDLDALPFAVMLVLYEREEGPYDQSGLQPLLDELDALYGVDLAVALEPTDNTLQLGCLGAIHARIALQGKAAHSARPWQGDNAIHKAGPLLTRLFERPVREVDVRGLIFRESMNVTLASGGRTRNVIPDRFEMNLNYRFAAQGDITAAIDAAKDEIRQLAPDAEITFVDVAPPGLVPDDNPILTHMQTLGGLDVLPKEAWTDVARLAAHGIDAINFGPGAARQAHQKGEWASVEGLARCYDILERVLSTPLEVE